MVFEVHARDERLVAADDHHDQEVRDHDDVDQAEHDEHDRRLVQLVRERRAGHGHGLENVLQRVLVAERGQHEVLQLDPEMEHVHALREDQAEVEG